VLVLVVQSAVFCHVLPLRSKRLPNFVVFRHPQRLENSNFIPQPIKLMVKFTLEQSVPHSKHTPSQLYKTIS
jgi:hypothetical protein